MLATTHRQYAIVAVFLSCFAFASRFFFFLNEDTHVVVEPLQRKVQWAKDLYQYSDDDKQRCPRTKLYPFIDGCPAVCERPHPYINDDNDESLYHLDVIFWFGEIDKYSRGKPLRPVTVYDQGINFECDEELVKNFVTAIDFVNSSLATSAGNSGTVRAHFPDKIHSTLSYLCCLTKNETEWAREVTNRWVMDTYPFDYLIRLDHTQCVNARPNTWGVMLVADESTQQYWMSLNHQLRDRLKAHGIPIIVPREHQMEFHISLAAIQGGDDNTTGQLVHQITQRLSREYGGRWTGAGIGTKVSNWPRVTDAKSH